MGAVDYQLFNAVSIQDVYIEDLQGDTLIFTKSVATHFDLWKIVHGDIAITSLEFDALRCNLVVDKHGILNLDFILKAFKKPKLDQTPSTVSYEIKDFKLNNSSFSYRNLKYLPSTSSGQINFNRLKFNAINAEIALDLLNKDSLSVRVLDFNALETSGFRINRLATSIQASRKSVLLPNFELELPHSYLQMNDISLKYDSLGDFKHFAEKVKFKLPIAASYVAFSDLQSFVPSFKTIGGVMGLKGEVNGRISSLHFKKLELKYGKSILLQTDLDINGLPSLSDAFVYGKINEFYAEKSDIQDLISDIIRKPFVLPMVADQLGKISYKGNVTGFLSNLVVYGNLQTKVGSVSTDILLKLENDLKDLSYNGTVKSSNFQLGKLLLNKQFGKISFIVNTEGGKKWNSNLQGVVKATVSELLFNDYLYHAIAFGGKYDGRGFDGNVGVKDANVNAQFLGKIDLTKALPIFNFNLQVENCNLNALKLMKGYASK